MSVTALLQSADELVDFGPDLIGQHSQAVLAVVHAFLDSGGEEAGKKETADQKNTYFIFQRKKNKNKDGLNIPTGLELAAV